MSVPTVERQDRLEYNTYLAYYRGDWEVGDLVIWDNCGTMHRATPYAPASGRLMHRTVLLGTESIA